ncbi:hypothetical protein CJF32_00002615 [Rutstroemia sp. NJR-2017a WRK4]|nr:hypothetical protein CJF32_00006348 [Rutstroemia sp. NJR-2017a WRK4]PQE11800.1 hypothetical protein CJF32_00002615 [Rutstroemia sp. NJR-2017a WRK4]
MSILNLNTRETALGPVHGVNRGAQVTGVACASLALPWIAVILRFYVRTRIQRFFGPEDWLTVASMYIFSSELLYVFTTTITKLSIGVYFLRLSSRRYQSWIIYGVIGIVLSISTGYLFFLLFQCQPISYFWNQYDGDGGFCLSRSILANTTYTHAAMSAVTDWAFGILPIAFVWKMRMNPRTKFSVVLILSLGFFASTATLVRIYYIHELSITTDYTWEGINLVKWSLVEPAIGLTAASFATLRSLFQRILSRQRAYSSYSHTSKTSIRKYSTDRPRISEDEYSKQFAEMLGLSAQYGVRTYVYADRRIMLKEDLERAEAEKARNEEGDDSMAASMLSHREQSIDWTAGVKTTVITQTLE